MTVTITYRDNTTETFTSVSSYSNDGNVVKIIGTDASGFAGTFELHWSDIKRVKIASGS